MEQEILNKILTKIDALDAKVSNFESSQDKILIKVLDIDARMESFATKEELNSMKNDVITTVDRFAKLHETLDQELVMLRNRYDRLEERLVVVESKLGLAI